MFVCVCKAVTDRDIEDAVEQGITNLRAMQQKLGVAQTCGTCACEVVSVIENKLAKTLAQQTTFAPVTELTL